MPLPSRGKHSITRTISAGPGKRLTAGAFSAIPPTFHPARTVFPTAAGSELLVGPFPPAAPHAVLRTHTMQAAIPIPCPRPLPQAPLPGARLTLLRPPHWQPLAATCPRSEE